MPNYILPLGATPLDSLEDKDVVEWLSQFKGSRKFQEGYKLSIDDKWSLFEIIQPFSIDSDGEPIPLKTALAMIAKFSGYPSSFSITKAVLDDFKTQLMNLKTHLPAGNDMGLRLYVGKTVNNDYGAVVVPMYGPTPQPNGARNRLLEKEKSFFITSGIPFFALVPSANTISTNVADCAAVIKNKDASTVEVVYFSETSFMAFVNGLTNPNFAQMQFSLARTPDSSNLLTLVIMFFDANGDPISSSGIFMGKAAAGICFDQGDLMPPPSSIPDSSF